MKSHISKWGNSAAVRIPTGVLSASGLSVNSEVNIESQDGRIVIEKAATSKAGLKLPFSEAALIAGLSPHTAHADEIGDLMPGELGL